MNDKMLGLLLETAKRIGVAVMADAVSSAKGGVGRKELFEILSGCVDSRSLEIFPQFPGRLLSSLDEAKKEIVISTRKQEIAGRILEETAKLFVEVAQGSAERQLLDSTVISVYFLNILQLYLAYYKDEEKNAFIPNGPLGNLIAGMLLES